MKSVGDMEMITFLKAPFTPFKVYRMSKLLFPIHSFDPLLRNILWNRRLFRRKKEIWYFLCFVKTQKKARFPWSIIFLFFQPFSFQSYAHSSWFLDGIHVITHRHSLFLSQFLRKKNCFLSVEEGKTGLCVCMGVNSISRASGWFLMPSLMCYLKVRSARVSPYFSAWS